MSSDTDVAVKRLRTLADRLKYARSYRRIGSNQLNELAGLQSGYTSRIESGERTRPSSVAMAQIARALQVRLEWLMHGVEPMIESTGGLQALPNLERCLATRGDEKRWTAAAVAVARTARQDRTLSEWVTLLDELQGVIGPVLAQKNW